MGDSLGSVPLPAADLHAAAALTAALAIVVEYAGIAHHAVRLALARTRIAGQADLTRPVPPDTIGSFAEGRPTEAGAGADPVAAAVFVLLAAVRQPLERTLLRLRRNRTPCRDGKTRVRRGVGACIDLELGLLLAQARQRRNESEESAPWTRGSPARSTSRTSRRTVSGVGRSTIALARRCEVKVWFDEDAVET